MSVGEGGPPDGWRTIGENFNFIEIVPPGNEEPERRFFAPSVFLISVESESDRGGQWNNDPLGLIRELDPDDAIFRVPRDEDVHVMTLRVNAEIPANPKYTHSMMQVTSGSTRVVIVHFKVAAEAGAQA